MKNHRNNCSNVIIFSVFSPNFFTAQKNSKKHSNNCNNVIVFSNFSPDFFVLLGDARENMHVACDVMFPVISNSPCMREQSR